jgi:hypothetical protein
MLWLIGVTITVTLARFFCLLAVRVPVFFEEDVHPLQRYVTLQKSFL